MTTALVKTESGTIYEFAGDKVRRVGGDAMRRDGDWLRLQAPVTVRLGEPLRMALEPLGEGSVTHRTTSPVVIVEVLDG